MRNYIYIYEYEGVIFPNRVEISNLESHDDFLSASLLAKVVGGESKSIFENMWNCIYGWCDISLADIK